MYIASNGDFLKITLVTAYETSGATSEYTVLSSSGKWYILDALAEGDSAPAPVLKKVSNDTQLAIYTKGDVGNNVNIVCRVDRLR